MSLCEITDIQRTKKGRYSIFLDGEFVCSLHVDVLRASRMKIGDHIDSHTLQEHYADSQMLITKDRALRLLGQRAYSAQKLMEKLMLYAEEETCQQVVERMQELGFVDDLDYARRFIEERLRTKGHSLRHIGQELVRRGIAKATAEEAIAEVADEVDDEAAIAAVILRKYWAKLEDEADYRRTMNALVRMGYTYGDIRRVLDNLLEDETYYNTEQP